ncbi:hypothetical protein NOF55_20165 [Rhizobiaceae bacterium BDR2-2]|uniref:Uncharacterized protein n=1 Tax=Ectorhizobium quercum TaxID=2965071 RepID=A0AAE3SWI2_9HYPH|nr:hypothetical protein [Ectorhizobium quercum]
MRREVLTRHLLAQQPGEADKTRVGIAARGEAEFWHVDQHCFEQFFVLAAWYCR